MHPLSEWASFILGRMDVDRRYAPQELRAIVPDVPAERLRDIMHELWIHRQVERVGDAGWRRHPSVPPHVSQPVSGDVEIVKPEDLFDHATFADFFK